MTSFIGDYICKLDSKNRVVLPVAFKKQMPITVNDRFVIKKDIYEKCLVLYSMEEWERQNNLIRSKINPYNKEHSKFLRAFYRGTAELTLDSNSRLLIPKRLAELVDISKEIYMSGQDRKIEIWSKENYELQEEKENDFADLAEKILGNN